MRIGFIIVLLCVPAAAQADLRTAIDGSVPILPAFTAARPGQPWPGVARLPPSSAPQPPEQTFESRQTMPLFDRRLNAEERSAGLAPDLTFAILRIEGIYDPTRIDASGLATHMQVHAGSASMSNVFGEQWHIGDSDANVSYAVRYIAQAWQKTDNEPCSAYVKHRPTVGIVELNSLGAGDCVRLAAFRGRQDQAWMRTTIALAPLDVPVFAAPEPGARMSAADFWAAQKVRVEAIKARIAFQRKKPRATLVSGR